MINSEQQKSAFDHIFPFLTHLEDVFVKCLAWDFLCGLDQAPFLPPFSAWWVLINFLTRAGSNEDPGRRKRRACSTGRFLSLSWRQEGRSEHPFALNKDVCASSASSKLSPLRLAVAAPSRMSKWRKEKLSESVGSCSCFFL